MKSETNFSQGKNIYNSFKMELGLADVSNQYIELSLRLLTKDHKYENLNDLSKSVDLKINSDRNEIGSLSKKISIQYIAGIHSNLENYLLLFKDLTGSPTYGCKDFDPERDVSRLEWTIKKCYFQSEEIKQLKNICEYYRLIRNHSLHLKSQDKSTLIVAKNRIVSIDELKKSVFGNLSAPNDIKEICFDDQVLFSRAANKLAEIIFKESKYDWEKIIDENYALLKAMKTKYNNNNDRYVQKATSLLFQKYPDTETNRIEIKNALEQPNCLDD